MRKTMWELKQAATPGTLELYREGHGNLRGRAQLGRYIRRRLQ